uniref:C2H2-type domain-containing protein n=1 Tax=Romanomermis culicivorax TaxID=13658 RepID=A0A915IPS0_ROMCU
MKGQWGEVFRRRATGSLVVESSFNQFILYEQQFLNQFCFQSIWQRIIDDSGTVEQFLRRNAECQHCSVPFEREAELINHQVKVYCQDVHIPDFSDAYRFPHN